MDKKLFEKLLNDKSTSATRHGKADWDSIAEALTQDGGRYTTTEIWEKFVNKVVNRLRTKDWLTKQVENKLALRVYLNGMYYWTFDPIMVEKFYKKK